ASGVRWSALAPARPSRTTVPQKYCTLARCHNRSSAFHPGQVGTGASGGACRIASANRADSCARWLRWSTCVPMAPHTTAGAGGLAATELAPGLGQKCRGEALEICRSQRDPVADIELG